MRVARPVRGRLSEVNTLERRSFDPISEFYPITVPAVRFPKAATDRFPTREFGRRRNAQEVNCGSLRVVMAQAGDAVTPIPHRGFGVYDFAQPVSRGEPQLGDKLGRKVRRPFGVRAKNPAAKSSTMKGA